jgi:hypothetical protein
VIFYPVTKEEEPAVIIPVDAQNIVLCLPVNIIYSCRKIEKAFEENIYFMWLSG